LKAKFFGCEFLGGRSRKFRWRNFNVHTGTHLMEKFWCNSPYRPRRHEPKYTNCLANFRIL